MMERENDSIDNVLSVLSGLKLRCDAVHAIIDKLISAEIDNSHLRWNEQTVTDDFVIGSFDKSCDDKFIVDSDSNYNWTDHTITDDSCDDKFIIDSDSNSQWNEHPMDDSGADKFSSGNCLSVIENSCGWNCLDKLNTFTISDEYQ
jgi:hypothetical protein